MGQNDGGETPQQRRANDGRWMEVLRFAVKKAVAERDLEWWAACAGVDTVAPTPEAVKVWLKERGNP